jgi:cytochrome bd ubiquinol oxidase subunit II
MATILYALVALALTAYVVLDGFDLGVGTLHRVLGRDDVERATLLRAIGPYWDGNEVWLICAGGLFFVAFPSALAAAFGGMYLAIFLVLWLLLGRGLSIELRGHLDDALWRSFWDTIFTLSSAGLALFLGVALGNVVRGFQVEASGGFSLTLFDDFSPWTARGLLDGYTLATGLYALVALTLHGAAFIALSVPSDLGKRAGRVARALAPLAALSLVGLSALTAVVRPDLVATWRTRPLVAVCLLVAVSGLGLAWRSRAPFVGSVLHLAGLLAATALAAYPDLLHARTGASYTVASAASPASSLRAVLWWLPFGLLLALAYPFVLARLHRDDLDDEQRPR